MMLREGLVARRQQWMLPQATGPQRSSVEKRPFFISRYALADLTPLPHVRIEHAMRLADIWTSATAARKPKRTLAGC